MEIAEMVDWQGKRRAKQIKEHGRRVKKTGGTGLPSWILRRCLSGSCAPRPRWFQEMKRKGNAGVALAIAAAMVETIDYVHLPDSISPGGIYG